MTSTLVGYTSDFDVAGFQVRECFVNAGINATTLANIVDIDVQKDCASSVGQIISSINRYFFILLFLYMLLIYYFIHDNRLPLNGGRIDHS